MQNHCNLIYREEEREMNLLLQRYGSRGYTVPAAMSGASGTAIGGAQQVCTVGGGRRVGGVAWHCRAGHKHHWEVGGDSAAQGVTDEPRRAGVDQQEGRQSDRGRELARSKGRRKSSGRRANC